MYVQLLLMFEMQISNWFMNARARIWRPMVVQMYREESKEAESQNQASGADE